MSQYSYSYEIINLYVSFIEQMKQISSFKNKEFPFSHPTPTIVPNDSSYYLNSTKKRASRASALRADGAHHIRGLVLTPGTSPTPWTRP